ncbi:tripartite tricarboxylate transporter TctB family protein [Actibacterium lipolyticum]|uniref:Tripartite tricarboxylate transporter TctB family protein n=1 Tax=Actibacterium lipolyticum TaxID=1524263 RepID=A0A238JK99_9RHOB|nr:tripartite tricarboxylate transporter TctB family protein [Actibacterium lipolyticum]SMX31088.1 Tripartite tricarboxylate transporter TctB family protein [Actibacterium lipolyticum]
MQVQRLKAIGLPLAIALLTVVYAFGVLNIRSQFDEGLVGPQFLPTVLVLLSLAMCAVIALRDIRKLDTSSEPAQQADADTRALQLRTAGLFVAIVAFIATFKPLGYAASTTAFSWVVLWLFSFGVGQPALRAAVAVAVSAAGYALFALAFGAHIPLGPEAF